MDFTQGVDHMNQVISYDRLVYFGYIFEESGLLSGVSKTSPRSKKAKPDVAFGHAAMPHMEIKDIQDEMVNKYHVSPAKIRNAGLKEMLELEEQELL